MGPALTHCSHLTQFISVGVSSWHWYMPHSIFLMYNPSVLCLPGFSYLQTGPRPDTVGDEIQVWFSLRGRGKGQGTFCCYANVMYVWDKVQTCWQTWLICDKWLNLILCSFVLAEELYIPLKIKDFWYFLVMNIVFPHSNHSMILYIDIYGCHLIYSQNYMQICTFKGYWSTFQKFTFNLVFHADSCN